MKVSANSQEATIQGFDIGADDYMTKPFSESLLISRIQNLLESRKKSNDRFGKSMFISELIKHRDNNEQQFIQRPIEIINKNIRNESFKLSNLAENINILVSFSREFGKKPSVFREVSQEESHT